MAAGCDEGLGHLATGALYSATANLDVDEVITASHNPTEYNGFKMCRGTAAGDEIHQLESLLENFEPGQVAIDAEISYQHT